MTHRPSVPNWRLAYHAPCDRYPRRHNRGHRHRLCAKGPQ